MNRAIWHHWSFLAPIFVVLSVGSCRKEAPKDPVQETKSDTSPGKTSNDTGSTDLIGPEDIAGEALADTGMKQELVEQVEIPPAPSFGENLKGWKPPKGKGKKTAGADEKFPREMWVLADVLAVRSGPSSKAAQAGSLSYGEKISVLAVTDNFAKIGEQKFVALKYLTDRKAKFIPVKK